MSTAVHEPCVCGHLRGDHYADAGREGSFGGSACKLCWTCGTFRKADMSKTRAALDTLLSSKPSVDVTHYDYQTEQKMTLRDVETGVTEEVMASPPGPWVCVDFADGERFAIWKHTGHIYRVQADGAVADDPLAADDLKRKVATDAHTVGTDTTTLDTTLGPGPGTERDTFEGDEL